MGKRREAFGLAWQMAKQELVGSNLRLATSVVLAGFASYASYRIHVDLGRDWPGDELIPIFVGPVGFVAVFLVLVIFNFVFRAPYQLLGNLDERVSNLERRLSPRFTVLSKFGQPPKAIEYGSAFLTASGILHTNVHRTNELLCIEVKNHTAATLEGCEAYLSHLQRVGAEEVIPWQTIPLQFVPLGDEQTITIPPHGQRSLGIFRVTGYKRTHLPAKDIPVAMMHLLEDKAEYEGIVTITARNAEAATVVPFHLTCDAPENEPKLTVTGTQPGGG